MTDFIRKLKPRIISRRAWSLWKKALKSTFAPFNLILTPHEETASSTPQEATLKVQAETPSYSSAFILNTKSSNETKSAKRKNTTKHLRKTIPSSQIEFQNRKTKGMSRKEMRTRLKDQRDFTKPGNSETKESVWKRERWRKKRKIWGKWLSLGGSSWTIQKQDNLSILIRLWRAANNLLSILKSFIAKDGTSLESKTN